MSPKKTVKNNQSGQALIEYVLLLAITVALVLGLMNQLYKPFGNWLQNYMGAYLECLIDIGELPSLGYEGGSGECTQRFAPATVTGGRQPIGGQGSGSNSSSKGSRNGSGNGGDGDDRSGSGGGGAGEGGSGRRRGSANSMGFPVGSKEGADGSGASSSSGTITEKLPESSYFKLRSSSAYSVGPAQSGPRAVGITGALAAEQQKIQRREQKAFTSAKLKNDEGLEMSKKSGKLIVKPVERKTASEDEAPSWGVSQYLKYALILLIIVAIILFLAGQALQISKSMEK